MKNRCVDHWHFIKYKITKKIWSKKKFKQKNGNIALERR